MNVWGTQGLFPDLVILLHLEPERGLLRSTEAPDRMELEGQEFHTKVADGYLKIAEEHPERFVVVEADQPPGTVFDGVRAALDKALGERRDDEGVEPLRAIEPSATEVSADDRDAGPAASSAD